MVAGLRPTTSSWTGQSPPRSFFVTTASGSASGSRRLWMVSCVWRRWKHSASFSLTVCLWPRTWMTSSARALALHTPSASCVLTAWRRLLCSRCSTRSSSWDSHTPPQRAGGALRRPPTDSVLTLSCVVLSGLICGHPLRRQSHRRLATSALQPMTNVLFDKIVTNSITFYTNCSHHHLLHHNTTLLDGAHIHSSYLDIPLISLTATLYYACCIKTAIDTSYCILSPCFGLRSVISFNKQK